MIWYIQYLPIYSTRIRLSVIVHDWTFSHQVGWNYDESNIGTNTQPILYHPSTKSKDLASHGRCVKSRSEIPQASNPSTDGSFKRSFSRKHIEASIKAFGRSKHLGGFKDMWHVWNCRDNPTGDWSAYNPSIPQPYVGSVKMDKYVRWCPSSESRDVDAHHLVNSMVCGGFW